MATWFTVVGFITNVIKCENSSIQMNASCEFLKGLPGSPTEDAVPRTIQIMYYLKKDSAEEHFVPLLVSDESSFIQGDSPPPCQSSAAYRYCHRAYGIYPIITTTTVHMLIIVSSPLTALFLSMLSNCPSITFRSQLPLN
jgi:hypothetical protein